LSTKHAVLVYISKVGRVLKLPEATPLDKDDSSLDKEEEVETIPKELKEKARAVKDTQPLRRVVKDEEGDVKIKDTLV